MSLQDAARPLVVVADDHQVNQMLMRASLAAKGFDSIVVGDGAEAVDVVRANRDHGRKISMVFMDLAMPRLDGFEAVKQIRALGIDSSELPILALTARPIEEVEGECRAAGMQGAFPKPLTINAMTRLVRTWAAGSLTRSAAISPELLDRFTAEKADARALLVRALAADDDDPVALAGDISASLHRLAGVAAYFGEPELGEASRRLETEFRAVRTLKALVALAHETLGYFFPSSH